MSEKALSLTLANTTLANLAFTNTALKLNFKLFRVTLKLLELQQILRSKPVRPKMFSTFESTYSLKKCYFVGFELLRALTFTDPDKFVRY